MNSRTKGKVGERELAAYLTNLGFVSRRGQQFSGGGESPDVVSSFPYHIECKRVERLNMRDAVAQATNDASGKPWTVFHRWNNGQWLVTLSAEEFVRLVGKSAPPTPA